MFTLWRVQPTIEASSPWVSDDRSRIVPSSAAGPGFLGEPDEPRRHAAGHVEEVELLDVDGEAAQLAGQRGQQGVADRRLGGDQLAELVARQDDGLGRRERRRRGRPRRAVEQGELAEDVARPQASRGSPRRRSPTAARSSPRRTTMMNRASPGIAGMEDDLAATEPARPRPGRDALEGIVVEPGEERDPGE